MPDFTKVTVLHLAQAMAAQDPNSAVAALCGAENFEAIQQHIQYTIDCDVVTWHATSLAIRCGLLMEWLAAEAAA